MRPQNRYEKKPEKGNWSRLKLYGAIGIVILLVSGRSHRSDESDRLFLPSAGCGFCDRSCPAQKWRPSMKMTLLAVGKVKEKFYTQAIAEFEKRLSRYCRLDIVEVPMRKTPDGASPGLEEQILQKEGERLLKNIREDAFVIALAIDGKALSSVELAKKLKNWALTASVISSGSSGALWALRPRCCPGRTCFSAFQK